MTIQLNELVLGDLVLGFNVKTQLPAFSKLILWAEADYTSNMKYLLVELEDESTVKVKADQLIIVEGEPIIITPEPPEPVVVEPAVSVCETTPLITGSVLDIADSGACEKASDVSEKGSDKTDTESQIIENQTADAISNTSEKQPGVSKNPSEISEKPPEELEIPPEPTEEIEDIVITTSNIVMSKTVKPGDSLYKRNIGYVPIKSVTKIVEKGFCRPITVSGTILVDNIAISCYHNLGELYVKEKHVMTAQTQGRVGYSPLVFFRKFFKGDTGPLVAMEKPHWYARFVNSVFGQKKK